MGNNHNSVPAIIEIIGMGAKKYGGFEKFLIEEMQTAQIDGVPFNCLFFRRTCMSGLYQ